MTTSPKTKTPASSPHRPSHRRTLRRKRSLPFGGQPGQHSPDNEPESVSESKALENPERALEDPERALEDPERLREPQESLGRLEESRPPGEVCCLSPSGEHHPGLRGAGPTRRTWRTFGTGAKNMIESGFRPGRRRSGSTSALVVTNSASRRWKDAGPPSPPSTKSPPWGTFVPLQRRGLRVAGLRRRRSIRRRRRSMKEDREGDRSGEDPPAGWHPATYGALLLKAQDLSGRRP